MRKNRTKKSITCCTGLDKDAFLKKTVSSLLQYIGFLLLLALKHRAANPPNEGYSGFSGEHLHVCLVLYQGATHALGSVRVIIIAKWNKWINNHARRFMEISTKHFIISQYYHHHHIPLMGCQETKGKQQYPVNHYYKI